MFSNFVLSAQFALPVNFVVSVNSAASAKSAAVAFSVLVLAVIFNVIGYLLAKNMPKHWYLQRNEAKLLLLAILLLSIVVTLVSFISGYFLVAGAFVLFVAMLIGYLAECEVFG
jgi:uncharacterized membrane protein